MAREQDTMKIACKIFMDTNIREFPLNPLALAEYKGIKAVTYETFCRLTGTSEKEVYAISPDGFSTYFAGSFLIVFNKSIDSKERRRWTITHELCHIHLDHISLETPVLTRDKHLRSSQESEADLLSAALLCPIPVAHLTGAESQRELRFLFGISREASIYRFADLTRVREQGAFYLREETLWAYAQFFPFISQSITQLIRYRAHRRCQDVIITS